MNSITAEQLVFARVESVLSRSHTNGYQTVYHSPGLQRADVTNIERRVRRFGYEGHPADPANDETKRWQFFPLDQSRVVIAQSVPAAHDQWIDRSYRPGTFICHALVLERSQFGLPPIYGNPFVVLDSVTSWVTDGETLAGEYGPAATPPGALEFSVQRLCSHDGSSSQTVWSSEQILELYKLAHARSDGPITVIGSCEEIHDALGLMFHLLGEDPPQRLRCFFDSYCSHRPEQPDGWNYWAIGGPTMKPGRLSIDARRGEITESGGRSGETSLFFRWLAQGVNGAEIARQAATVQALSRAYQKKKEPQTCSDDFDREACVSFYQVAQEETLELIEQELTKRLTRTISRELARSLVGVLEPHRLVLSAAQPENGLSPNFLATICARLIETHVDDMAALDFRHRDWRTLQRLAREVEDWRLLHWAVSLDKPPIYEWGQLRAKEQSLESMSAEAFESALALSPVAIPPSEFVHPKHIRVLLAKLRPWSLDHAQLFQLLTALLELDETPDLAAWTEYALQLPADNIRRLAAQLNKRNGELDGCFAAAITNAVS